MNNGKSKIIEYLENELRQLEQQVSVKKEEMRFCNGNEELLRRTIYSRAESINDEIKKIKKQINNLT